MSFCLIVVNSPPGRVTGYLRTLILEIHPGVFFSATLNRRVREATWTIIENWYLATGKGDALLVTPDKASPGGIQIRSFGRTKRKIMEIDGVLCLVKTLNSSDSMT